MSEELKGLFEKLEKEAYNVEMHSYYVKPTNQIIRKHFEELESKLKAVECVHPFSDVISKCNGEINKCLKCGKQLNEN